jgi:hypothetical protein
MASVEDGSIDAFFIVYESSEEEKGEQELARRRVSYEVSATVGRFLKSHTIEKVDFKFITAGIRRHVSDASAIKKGESQSCWDPIPRSFVPRSIIPRKISNRFTTVLFFGYSQLN